MGISEFSQINMQKYIMKTIYRLTFEISAGKEIQEFIMYFILTHNYYIKNNSDEMSVF